MQDWGLYLKGRGEILLDFFTFSMLFWSSPPAFFNFALGFLAFTAWFSSFRYLPGRIIVFLSKTFDALSPQVVYTDAEKLKNCNRVQSQVEGDNVANLG